MANQFRCASCAQYFAINRFGINRNGERAKICIDCDIADDRFRETIAEQTDLIRTTDIEVRPHPIYANYGATRTGICVNLTLRHAIGRLHKTGYIYLTIHHLRRSFVKQAHRFVYECWNGVIADETLVIKHLDNDKQNNALSNLMLDTQSANLRDAYRDGLRDRTHIARRRVIAINLDNGIEREFASMSAAGHELGISKVSVQRCCDGTRDSSHSRTTGSRYSFRYID